jgi:hypothetical protein
MQVSGPVWARCGLLRTGAAAAFAAAAPLVPDPKEAATCESIISSTWASPIAQVYRSLRLIQYQWYANER